MERKNIIFTKLFFTLLAVFTVCFISTSAFANNNDFKLTRLCDASGCDGGVDDFKTLTKSYASILTPMHFQPARTLGEEGFEIAVESKMSFSTKDDSSWKATDKNANAQPAADGTYSAPDLFATVELHMRKGLPFSLEVEGVFNWLAESEIFYVGAGLRWAITEGFWYLPDLSVRAHVGTIVGASELWLLNVNMDVAISYTWGLGGIASITPYAGYSLLTSWASSRPLVIYGANGETSESVFNRVQNYNHRGFVGVELKGDVFVLGLEGEFGEQIMSAGVKIGANF